MEPYIVHVSSEFCSELRDLITPWPVVFVRSIGLGDGGAVMPFRFLFAIPGQLLVHRRFSDLRY